MNEPKLNDLYKGLTEPELLARIDIINRLLFMTMNPMLFRREE